LTQEELHKEEMGLYSPGQIMNDPLYGQISYKSSLSIAFKLKVGSNLKQFWVEMTAAAGKNIAKHVMRPVMVIPASHFMVCYTHC